MNQESSGLAWREVFNRNFNRKKLKPKNKGHELSINPRKFVLAAYISTIWRPHWSQKPKTKSLNRKKKIKPAHHSMVFAKIDLIQHCRSPLHGTHATQQVPNHSPTNVSRHNLPRAQVGSHLLFPIWRPEPNCAWQGHHSNWFQEVGRTAAKVSKYSKLYWWPPDWNQREEEIQLEVQAAGVQAENVLEALEDRLWLQPLHRQSQAARDGGRRKRTLRLPGHIQTAVEKQGGSRRLYSVHDLQERQMSRQQKSDMRFSYFRTLRDALILDQLKPVPAERHHEAWRVWRHRRIPKQLHPSALLRWTHV